MVLNIVLVSVIVGCLGGVIFIVAKKWPRLKSLDVETVPEEQSARVRDRILLDRMKRKTKKSKQLIRKTTKPAFSILGSTIKSFVGRLYDLEKKYQKEAARKSPLNKKQMDEKIKALMNEALVLAKDKKNNEAEKKFIEIISFDPKNLQAYHGLGEVYLEIKEYKQALQIFQFVLKLVEKKGETIVKKDEHGQEIKTVTNAVELADAQNDLGNVYQKMNKLDDALKNYQKAYNLESSNPRYLDQIIEISIVQKNKSLALEMLKKLEEVNPDNQKIRDYYEKLKEL